MARPIKEIPVLTGKNADRFARITKENEKKTVLAADYERAKAAYKRLKIDTGSRCS